MSARCRMVQGWLEEHTRKPVLGVLPYLHGHEQALTRERAIDRLADTVELHLDTARVLESLA